MHRYGFLNDGKLEQEAREGTARRLQFGRQSVANAIKEFLSTGNVTDNKSNLVSPNAYEKLAQEEIDDLRKLIHHEFKQCNVKRKNPENQDISYPTLASLHQIVTETGRFPTWSLDTFRKVLLGMDIKFKSKSEVDKSILIEDSYIENWRIQYLLNMQAFYFLLLLYHLDFLL